jgi:hypothetical protein
MKILLVLVAGIGLGAGAVYTANQLLLLQELKPVVESAAGPTPALLAEVRITKGFFAGCSGVVTGKRDGEPTFSLFCVRNHRQLTFTRISLAREDYQIIKP